MDSSDGHASATGAQSGVDTSFGLSTIRRVSRRPSPVNRMHAWILALALCCASGGQSFTHVSARTTVAAFSTSSTFTRFVAQFSPTANFTPAPHRLDGSTPAPDLFVVTLITNAAAYVARSLAPVRIAPHRPPLVGVVELRL